MPSDIAIDIQNVSKCYRRYNHPIDRLKELIIPNLSKGQKFWALDNGLYRPRDGDERLSAGKWG